MCVCARERMDEWAHKEGRHSAGQTAPFRNPRTSAMATAVYPPMSPTSTPLLASQTDRADAPATPRDQSADTPFAFAAAPLLAF